MTATGPKECRYADDFGAPLDLAVPAFDGVCNRYDDLGADVRPGFIESGVCCEHPGQRHREHESAGRSMHWMSRELALVADRLCDSPGCAESADP